MTHEELMADDTQYCCYCGQEKVRFHCCGENHFQTFAQMDKEDQAEFFQDEEQHMSGDHNMNQYRHKPWIGLTEEEVEQIVDETGL